MPGGADCDRRVVTGAPLIPLVQSLHLPGMHRLIPSRYSHTGTVLEDVTENDVDLAHAAELDAASNERVLGELQGLSGISQFELVYGIPNAHIIRAAFLHPGIDGARFNDATRGAWYAAEEVETCLAEVSYHRFRRLREIIDPDEPDQMPSADTSSYDDWQADFHADFHVLEPEAEFAECLAPEPVPQCYRTAQVLARKLLEQGSNGIVYPSVRRPNAKCLACFRPPLVYQPRRAKRYELRMTRHGKQFDLAVTARDPEEEVRDRRAFHLKTKRTRKRAR